MKCMKFLLPLSVFVSLLDPCQAFQVARPAVRRPSIHCVAAQSDAGPKKDNKAMAFLRKMGKVGGGMNVADSVGVDEGPAGSTSSGAVKAVRKAKSAYQECTESGVIDDLSEAFPFTSSGTQWTASTDQVMGGVSSGSVSREVLDGKDANVLRGVVSLENEGGFIQMATNLALDPSKSDTVDASEYDGVELDVLYEGDEESNIFNVHLRNPACQRVFSSYRATFEIRQGKWKIVRLPWSEFLGHGPGAEDTPFDASALRRIGLLALGKEREVCLGLSGVRFYSVI